MKVGKNTVVSLAYELFDLDGNLTEKTSEPIGYLHGDIKVFSKWLRNHWMESPSEMLLT